MKTEVVNKISLSMAKNALSRSEMKEILAGTYDGGVECLPRWSGCCDVCEDVCCGSGRCMNYQDYVQCV